MPACVSNINNIIFTFSYFLFSAPCINTEQSRQRRSETIVSDVRTNHSDHWKLIEDDGHWMIKMAKYGSELHVFLGVEFQKVLTIP